MGGSLIKGIFQPKAINAALEKTNVDFYCAIINIRIFKCGLLVFLSLGGGVAGGFVSTLEVINYGGSCGKVSLDSDKAGQRIRNCNTTSYQDSSGTITTEFSLFGLNEITGSWFM